ncbi:MAG: N-6 DNA methylase [Candidatus Heimdallarchaeota archaeon]|nr:MAG: N-6 DNA methylase [Candidatus Heimdallarchaeota archaeon]
MTERTRLKSKILGQYYTPAYIVDYIIDQTIGHFFKTSFNKTNSLRILDPACGIGIFLIRALEYLSSQFDKLSCSNESLERTRRTIIATQLYGIDIDPTQVLETQKKLNCLNFNINFKTFNALIPPPSYSIQLDSSDLKALRIQYKRDYIDGAPPLSNEREHQKIVQIENQIRKTIITKLVKDFDVSSNIQPMQWEIIFPEIKGKFDVIVGNPPWGAALFSSDLIRFYNVGTQQVDSWSLFIERSLQALNEGGRLGVVIPNTLLLNENYSEIRRFILKEYKIIKIVNLGENIFPEITQPCMIIVVEKGIPPPNHKLEVIRHIPTPVKKNLKAERDSLSSLVTLSCSQDRFLRNSDYQFDIFSIGFEELKETIEKDLHHNKIEVKPLGDLVENARGVEINRNGKISQCSSCGWWSSPPSHFNANGVKIKQCVNPQCHEEVTQRDTTDFIVFDDQFQPERDKPFLVGHHIQRYYIKNHKYIDPTRKGIKYKDPILYQGSKLLLRKTGHGIKTAIDYNNRWVNQVVYLFKLKKNTLISLEYIMGVINSKLISKYFFIEFADPYRQDFPHFTQKKFLRLPIKVPTSKNESNLVNQVAECARTLQSHYQEKYFVLNSQLREKEINLENLNKKIEKLEKEIDDSVFRLYEITPEIKRQVLSEHHV